MTFHTLILDRPFRAGRMASKSGWLYSTSTRQKPHTRSYSHAVMGLILMPARAGRQRGQRTAVNAHRCGVTTLPQVRASRCDTDCDWPGWPLPQLQCRARVSCSTTAQHGLSTAAVHVRRKHTPTGPAGLLQAPQRLQVSPGNVLPLQQLSLVLRGFGSDEGIPQVERPRQLAAHMGPTA